MDQISERWFWPCTWRHLNVLLTTLTIILRSDSYVKRFMYVYVKSLYKPKLTVTYFDYTLYIKTLINFAVHF